MRIVVINKSQTKRKTVSLRLPVGAGGTATVERMLAPSAHARRGVTLGGRTYGTVTQTGQLAAPEVARARAKDGRIALSMPRASAALITVG